VPELADVPVSGTSKAIGEMARLGVLSRVREVMAERQADGTLVHMDVDFEKRLDDLIGFLGNRPFFYADRPSRADLTVVAFLGSLETGHIPGGHRMMAERPVLVGLSERVKRLVAG
jgi:hypothetical protein